jgi:hypothetical protein
MVIVVWILPAAILFASMLVVQDGDDAGLQWPKDHAPCTKSVFTGIGYLSTNWVK